ncbi:MAG: GTP-binding protein [Rhizobiales bacterium]|nr:GTP-binding protein [Hyphomicrobiales bacterium]
MDDRLALTLVTGFLGSGKTTLIRRYIETDQGADTGVIVNEFGEAGVDHSLFVHAAEQVELVDGGCLCCAKRADVAQAMYRLVQMSRETGAFRRTVLETSGLADPAPIVATLQNDPWLKSHVRLASIVTVIDAVAGIGNLDLHPEARRQLSLADTVVVTKTDMRASQDFDALVEAIRRHSPDARIFDAQEPDYLAHDIFGGAGTPALAHGLDAPGDGERHSADLSSFTLRIAETLDWPVFTLWLSALLHAHGDRILRVKGLLKTSSADTRLAVHGVQHVMHPPIHLPADEADESYLVFITRGIEKAAISSSFHRTMSWGAMTGAR